MTTDVEEGYGRPTERWVQWLRGAWPYVLLIVVVALPLLALGVWIVVKTYVLGNPAQGADGAFASLVAGGLATAATLLGALVTNGYNVRAERRLQLEAVVRDLEYVPEGRPRIAGAIATMVQLGEQSVAMRVLAPAWAQGDVDDGTATWLIGQVLCGGRKNITAIHEAAALLREHSRHLTDVEHPGYFSFPGYCQRGWRSDLPVPVKQDVLLAMGETLISQPLAWWPNRPPRWPARIFAACAIQDEDEVVRLSAALLFGVLHDRFPEQLENLVSAADLATIRDLQRGAVGSELVTRGVRTIARRLERWACDEEAPTHPPPVQLRPGR